MWEKEGKRRRLNNKDGRDELEETQEKVEKIERSIVRQK